MNKKNILFITNFFKTEAFISIANNLDSEKNKIFWLTTSKKEKGIINKNRPKDYVFLFIPSLNNTLIQFNLDIKLNEIFDVDRKLTIKDWKLLNQLSNFIYEHLKEFKNLIVIGEITHSHEVIAHRIANLLGHKFLTFQSARIPYNRLIFSFDEFQIDLIKVSNDNPQIIKPNKPKYFTDYKKNVYSHNILFKLKQNIHNFHKYRRRRVEKNNIIACNNTFQLLYKYVKKQINILSYKFVTKTNFSKIKDEKYVFYPLHVQPESSIDHLGLYYSDQYLLIRMIWKMLPPDVLLVVKEHIDLGYRNYSFYRKILALKNVVLVDESINSYNIIKNSICTFSVSGTACYEAAIMNKLSFTFSPMFFNKLKYSHHVTVEDFKNSNSFSEFLKRFNNSGKLSIQEFSGYIFKHSIDAIFSDVITLPQVLKKENIVKIANVIKQLVNNDIY